MHARTILLAGLAAGLTTTLAPLGMAQSPSRASLPSAPAQPASPPVKHGPPIPGVCIYSEGGIVEGSKVGQSVIARLRVLKQQVDAELQPEADAINGEAKSLDGQRATMNQATFQSKQANLQLRAANLEKRAQLRSRELQATQAKQFQVIGAALDPILRQLYEQKQCAVMFDRDGGGVRAANPAMDLTGQAVAALDQKLQALTFDREHLDSQPGGAAPPKS
jgi:Skp family chaperone for outer membrane proteins